MIVGRVLAIDGARPVHGAVVRLREADGQVTTATDGKFRLEAPHAGHFTLLVRGVGYAPAQAVLELPGDSGIVALATLEARAERFDGCGDGVLMRADRPWWKWW